MSQVAFSPAADNSVITPAAETETQAQVAFNSALYALTQAALTQADAKADGKEASTAVALAERAAQWAAFDVVATINDEDEARTQGHALGGMIAKARDVTAKSYAVYHQRGRDLVTYKAEVAKAGLPHTYTKGEKAGQTVEGRALTSPFAVVQKLRANSQKNAEKKANDAPYKAKARELVAVAQGMSDGDLVDALSTPGAESMALAVMIEDQIAALRSQSTILEDFRAMLLRLADASDEVQAEAWAMAQLIAPMEA